MRLWLLPITCAGLLAGCNSEPDVDMKNASVADVAREVGEQSDDNAFVRPGKWEAKVTFEEMTMPGVPAEMAAQMKGMAGRTETQQSCLTAEEAKRPKEDFFAGKDKSCRYDHFKMGDGEIDAAMKCSAGGVSQLMTMKGSYTPDSYQMAMAMKAEAGAGPAGGMTMKVRVDAKRIGECDGKAT